MCIRETDLEKMFYYNMCANTLVYGDRRVLRMHRRFRFEGKKLLGYIRAIVRRPAGSVIRIPSVFPNRDNDNATITKPTIPCATWTRTINNER